MKYTIPIMTLVVTAGAQAAGAQAAGAQAPGDAGPGIGPAMKRNAAELRQYTYKRRTNISINGQSRMARVELIRYVDGRPEAVPLEGPARPAAPVRTGPLRARMEEKKRKEMKEEVEALTSLLRRYVSFESDSMRTTLEKATISSSHEPETGLKVVAKGIVTSSDSLTLTWSVANHRPERIEIRTDLEGKAVSATVEYASLPSGPFYAAHTALSEPKKDIAITIDTFDYARSGGAQ